MEKLRPQSNNHRHAYVSSGVSVDDCRKAVETALSRHGMFRTLAIKFDEQTPLHVVMRPSEKYYQHCITVAEPVETAADLKRLLWNNPKYDYAAFPGPLFRIVLAHVKDENCAGFVYMAQHSAFDGISLPFLLEDIDALASGKPAAQLMQRVPFKVWIDSEYSLRNSLSSKLSVDWHLRRLRGLSSKKDSLFPKKRTPGWFKGDTTGWIDPSTRQPGAERKSLVPDGDGVTGIAKQCALPDIQRLKQEHGIEPSTVLKVALALINAKLTGTTQALLAQYQAGRSWPYLQEWQASRLPSAMEVDGPTVQLICMAIETSREETALSLLRRTQAEQADINKHAHAPFDDIIARLNEDGSGDGDVMSDIRRRQIFNWLPGSPDGFERLRKIQQVSRTDVGILWNCLQLDQTHVQVMPSWDDAQLTPDEVEDMLAGVCKVVEALATEANWSRDAKALA